MWDSGFFATYAASVLFLASSIFAIELIAGFSREVLDPQDVIDD